MGRRFETHLGRRYLAVAACAATFASAVEAMDRFAPVVLAHVGFGGIVEGYCGSLPTGPIYGVVATSEASTRAALWPSAIGGTAPLLLPWPGGATARAIAGQCTGGADGVRGIVVGAADDANALSKPVLWTLDGPAPPRLAILPTLGGGRGEAAGLVVLPGGGLVIAGTTEAATGADRATVWRPLAAGGYEAVDLGTLGGAQSRASSRKAAAGTDPSGQSLVVAGQAQTGSGAWHACEWFSADGGSTWSVIDRHPGGRSSGFTGTAPNGTVGTAISSTGRTTGIIYNGHAGLGANLVVSGYDASVAEGLVDTRYGQRAVGSVLKSSTGVGSPALWNVIGTRITGYPMAALADGIDPLAPMRLYAVSEASMAGSSLDLASGAALPLLLLGQGPMAPDSVVVELGSPAGTADETKLWKSGDGRALRIRRASAAGDDAVVALQYFRAAASDGDLGSLVLRTRCRAIGSPSATVELGVDFYEFGADSFMPAGASHCGLGWSDGVVTASAAGRIDAAAGEVRVRLRLRNLTGSASAYELDSALLSASP